MERESGWKEFVSNGLELGIAVDVGVGIIGVVLGRPDLVFGAMVTGIGGYVVNESYFNEE